MKRRSARPFVVEVKNNRAPRDPIKAAVARSRAGLMAATDPMPPLAASEPARRPPPEAAAERPGIDVPARRVLPSLVPMYGPSDDPEPPVEAVEPRLPRVRRPRVKAERPAASIEMPRPTTPREAPPAAPPVAGGTVAATRDASAVQPRTEARPPRPPRPSRQETGLRPGERWKRRLPRILR